VTRTAPLGACSEDWPSPVVARQMRKAQEIAIPWGKNFMTEELTVKTAGCNKLENFY
jgi:hypothetical protein